MTAVCKIDGCTNPEKASRGRYAHLCVTHIERQQSNGTPPELVELSDAVLLQNAADVVADLTFEYEAAKTKLQAAVVEVQTIVGRLANR